MARKWRQNNNVIKIVVLNRARLPSNHIRKSKSIISAMKRSQLKVYKTWRKKVAVAGFYDKFENSIKLHYAEHRQRISRRTREQFPRLLWRKQPTLSNKVFTYRQNTMELIKNTMIDRIFELKHLVANRSIKLKTRLYARTLKLNAIPMGKNDSNLAFIWLDK